MLERNKNTPHHSKNHRYFCFGWIIIFLGERINEFVVSCKFGARTFQVYLECYGEDKSSFCENKI